LGEIFRGKSHGTVEDIQITLDVRCNFRPHLSLVSDNFSSLNDVDMPWYATASSLGSPSFCSPMWVPSHSGCPPLTVQCFFRQYIPIFYQAAKHHTATASGIDLLPFMLGTVLSVIIAGQIVGRVGY
jgi:hypothetical protein